VVNVARPFRVSAATRNGRLTVVSESDSSVRVYSAKPRTVTFQLVKTRDKSLRQNHKKKVRLKKGVTFVRGLEAGRTYRVKYAKKKFLRITPIHKVADVQAVEASFTSKKSEARLSVDHVAEWARGDARNTMYRWKITSYGDSTLRNGFLAAGGTSEDPTMVVDLPEEGMFRVDVAAVNPLGSTSMTLFSQEEVQKAWKKRGPQGQIRLGVLPANMNVEVDPSGLSPAEVTDPNVTALGNANAAANSAEYAAIDAARAAGRAMEASSPEEASREAAKARQAATRADEFASLANDWKDQIPGPNENRLDAEAAVDRANSAAERAEFSANDATWFAADHWRNEAKRAMADAALHAEAAAARTSDTADEDATASAIRARYAATQAAREASGITDASPDRIEQAQQAVIEADHAADQAEAAAAMARVAEQYRQAEVIATMPDEAVAASAEAAENADQAREISDQEQADPYDSAAASYADRAEVYADAAAVAAADVAYRYQAQQEAASGQQNLQDSAVSLIRARTSADSATAMGHAQASHGYAGAAETDAVESAEQAGMVTDTSDERPAADQAASEAAVAAELARANSDDAMRHITNMTAGESKTQHDLADAVDDSASAAVHAGNARVLAERAWTAVGLIDDANTEDLTAATERANVTQAYADLATAYAEETRQRELTQTANEESAGQLQQAAETVFAEDARAHVVEARNQAAAAEAARDAIAASIADREAAFGPDARVNDQLARAEAAAQQARANALAAEQYAMASQEMLNEQLVISEPPVVDLATGEVTFTFADNPNDARESLDYVVTADRGGAATTGNVTENVNGTVSVVFPNIDGPRDAATVFTITPISWERTSTNPTIVAPTAPTAVELQALLTMPVATTGNDTCESNLAPGALQGTECVATKPLAYDKIPMVYDSKPRTGRNVKVGETPGGACNYLPNSNSPTGFDIYCPPPNPVYEWRWDPTPSGYAVVGNNWVATEPNSPTRDPRIDSAFSDKTWLRDGNQWLAISPLPAADFNDAVTYTYEPDLNTYVTRNNPDHFNTYRPVFTSLPATITGWSVKGETHTDLDGQDIGRTSTPITVHTLGGNVTINADVFTTDPQGDNHYRP